MRLFIIQILLISSTFSFSQELTNGMTFYLNQDSRYGDGDYKVNFDSSYHVKYVDGKYQIYAKDSSFIFNEKFDDYPSYAKNGFFKAKSNSDIFVFNPAKKFIKKMNPAFGRWTDFNSLFVIPSSFSGELLITLKENLFLNFNDKIIFERDMYFEESDEDKKYKIITNVDETVRDLELEDVKPEEYDEFTKKQLFLFENQNTFLKTISFDILLNSYDGFDNYSAGDKYNERLYHIKKNKKHGVLSNLGHFVLEPKFDYIEFYENENYMNDPLKYLMIKAYIGKTCFVYNAKGEFQFQNDYLRKDDYSYPYAYELGTDFYFTGFVLNNKKKMGLIHENGQIILPPIFDNYDYYDFKINSLITAPTNMSLSTSCSDYQYNQYFIGVDNKTNEKHFYSPNGKFLNKIVYDYPLEYNRNGYLSYDLEGKTGLIGPGACVLKNPEFEGISIYQGMENMFIINTEEKSYFLDGKGSRMFNRDFANAYFIDTNYAIVNFYEGNSYNYGLLDLKKSQQNLIWKIKPDYSSLTEIENTFVNTKKVFDAIYNVQHGVINEENEVLLDFSYDMLRFKNNLIITFKNKKYGLHNFHKELLLENKYDSIGHLNSEVWSVKLNDKFSFYNSYKKEFTSKFMYDEISIQNTVSGIFYFVKENGKWGVLNTKFEKLVESKYESIKFDHISKEFECLNENKQMDCFFVK